MEYDKIANIMFTKHWHRDLKRYYNKYSENHSKDLEISLTKQDISKNEKKTNNINVLNKLEFNNSAQSSNEIMSLNDLINIREQIYELSEQIKTLFQI